LITDILVENYINVILIRTLRFMDKPVLIFGAGGIGIAAYEIFRSQDIIIYGFLDDRKDLIGKEIDDIQVLGSMDDDGYLKFIGNKCEAFVASDDNKERKSIIAMLKDRRKVMPVNAIHKNSSIAPSAIISYGIFIDDGVIIGANSKIGNHCIIHSGAIIENETTIADLVQIGAGVTIGAGVKIEKEVFIGTGSIVVPGISIGKNARIGAGSVVIEDISNNVTVFGNPAKPVSI